MHLTLDTWLKLYTWIARVLGKSEKFYSVITSYHLGMNSIVDKKDPHYFGGRLSYPGVAYVMWIVLGICLIRVIWYYAYTKSTSTHRAIV